MRRPFAADGARISNRMKRAEKAFGQPQWHTSHPTHTRAKKEKEKRKIKGR